MKPYHTSFMKVAAFLLLLSSLFVTAKKAEANCSSFTLSTQDSAWSFTAAAGSTQSRTIWITNVSTETITVDLTLGGSYFGVSAEHLTIHAGDTASVVITFKPSSTQAAGNVQGYVTFTKHGTDCRTYLMLNGTVTSSNNTGHDHVVTITPTTLTFPAVAVGKDTCLPVYLINYTGAQATITSITFANGSNFKLDPAFTGNITMDSGGYYRFSVCCTGDANHTEFSDSLLVTVEYGGATHHLVCVLHGHTASSNTSGGDALVADPHSFSFGSVATGTTSCKNVVVTNKSDAPIVITGWNHCDGNNFSVTPAFTGNDTLPAGASMTFTICYSPTGNDSSVQDCKLNITYRGANTDTKTLTVGFYGMNPGSNTTHHDACLATEQGDNYHDAIVVGTTANHTIHLINTTSRSITVNSATITGTDASVFAIVTSMPITVPANSTSTTLTYSFSPTSNSKHEFSATVTLALSGDSITCQSVDGHLIGYVEHSSTNIDTVVRPIFPNEPRTIVLEGSSRSTSRTFYFTNNLNVDCTVNSITMAVGTYFTITSTNPSPTPFTLHPGDNLQVVVTYTATDNQVHHDQLLVDANHSLQAQSFDVQGLQVAAGVSNTLPTGVAINVSPNPASNYLTVDMAGIRSADIQVIDLLGNTVNSAKSSTIWKWNASNAVAGSYIVRISGESNSGEQFVASKRVIISK